MSDMENTEYTPTTDWVRAAYTRAVPESLVASQAEMMAEFDRWFAGALADAWDEGWSEHYLEDVRQVMNPLHPITKVNPYRVEGEGKTS